MKKLRFYVFPYRDLTFLSQYGSIVRDLAIIEKLSLHPKVDEVVVFNRPTTIHEIILAKKSRWKATKEKFGVTYKGANSNELFGPMLRRRWVKSAYKKYYQNEPQLDKRYINIVLDFLPIGDMPDWVYNCDLYWYDLIDNFTKHNRFSESEKYEVQQKYSNVFSLSDVITGVSKNALQAFEGHRRCEVIKNGVDSIATFDAESNFEFDFGFIGFITNKFDLSAIQALSNNGFSVGIFGEFYEKSAKEFLSDIDNVYVHGKFTKDETWSILSKFKVGLVPYRRSLLHDESPLKIYQYFSAGKPVLSSFDFGFCESEEIKLFDTHDELIEKAKEMTYMPPKLCPIELSNKYKFLWDDRISEFLAIVESIFKK